MKYPDLHSSHSSSGAPLPVNFSYVIDGKLAGCATPTWSFSVPEALRALSEEGIRAILSLDEEGLSDAMVKEFGFEYHHSPIPDFHAPAIDQLEECLSFIRGQIEQGRPVVVHCRAGMGRTGTILACYLVRFDSVHPETAIERTRDMRPGSIETGEQEQLVRRYAEYLQQGR